MFPHSLSYLISCPISFILSLIFFWSFRSEGKLGHLGLLRLETFGPWEDSTEDYLFWSNVNVPYKGVDPSLGSLLRLGYQPLFLLDALHTRQPLLPIPTRLDLLNSGSSTRLYGMRLTAAMCNGAVRGQPVDSHMIICHTSVT